MLVVVALGGNALLQRGESLDFANQERNVRIAVAAVAEIARRHRLVITHGNGPQVGLLALQAAAFADTPAYPLDVLGAETEGMIGYLLERELRGHLPETEVVSVLTQVEVEADDPAFTAPSKPIGPVYSAGERDEVAERYGWTMRRDGDGYRRVVPSPQPRCVLELEAIRILVEAGVTVICAGGGGVPVVAERGHWRGVEAVVDKDLAAALIALELGAEALLLLTDVEAVFADWGTSRQRPLREATVAELQRLELDPGSMAPKVEAARRFLDGGGRRVGIGRLQDALPVLEGEAGTTVRR